MNLRLGKASRGKSSREEAKLEGGHHMQRVKEKVGDSLEKASLAESLTP